jgi:hypothetical protein
MDASTIDKHTRNIHLTTLIRPFSNVISKNDINLAFYYLIYTEKNL